MAPRAGAVVYLSHPTKKRKPPRIDHRPSRALGAYKTWFVDRLLQSKTLENRKGSMLRVPLTVGCYIDDARTHSIPLSLTETLDGLFEAMKHFSSESTFIRATMDAADSSSNHNDNKEQHLSQPPKILFEPPPLLVITPVDHQQQDEGNPFSEIAIATKASTTLSTPMVEDLEDVWEVMAPPPASTTATTTSATSLSNEGSNIDNNNNNNTLSDGTDDPMLFDDFADLLNQFNKSGSNNEQQRANNSASALLYQKEEEDYCDEDFDGRVEHHVSMIPMM
jgi:hypothetical protein